MIHCYYIGASLFLVILQTAIMPYLPLFDKFYDLLIPFIIYLGLTRPVRESIPFVFLLGFTMDNLSGSPFGLYLTTYFWVFVGVRWISKLLQVGNRILVSFVVVCGVVIEHFLFIGSFSMFRSDMQLPAETVQMLIIQAIWALFTGPFVLLFFLKMQNRLDNLSAGLFAKRNQ